MKFLRNSCCLIFIFTIGFVSAQIKFSSIPADLQLIPRDKSNNAFFKLSGKNLLPEYTQLRSIIKKKSSDSLVEEIILNLDSSNFFSIRHRLPVALAEYDLNIYLKNSNSELLVKTVHRLTAGDYFIIAGQSNALAASNGDYWGTDEMLTHSSLWIRGIGTHDNYLSPDYPCQRQDLNFYQSNSNWLQEGFVGVWGLTLQFNLSVKTGIPNCFINGASAGSSIDQNRASHTPSDLRTLDSCKIYDRTFKKVAFHGLDSAIKGIFWYQGESDAALAYSNSCDYLYKFHTLYTAWKADYPNLEKIFLLQLNTGCNEAHIGLLREIQRKISQQYSDVIIMSTFSQDVDDRNEDQCHYTNKGHKKIADNLLPIVTKYLYGNNLNDTNILPPKINKIFYSGENQLCLEFDMPVDVQQIKKYNDSGNVFIKDYFFGENESRLKITDVSSEKNLVFLNMAADGFKPKKISYLPHSYSFVPTLYTGPYIINQSNPKIAALSFYDFPVINVSNNSWNKSWSNFGSGMIGEQMIDEYSSVYIGDFTGDEAEELFVLNKDGTMHLFNYQKSSWQSVWTFAIDFSDQQQTVIKTIFQERNKLQIGDFNGDGKKEILYNTTSNSLGQPCLIAFSEHTWKKIWQGDRFIKGIPFCVSENICVGDFNGDDKDELLELTENSNNEMIEWQYNDEDFSPIITYKDITVPQSIYKTKFLAADLDGDGISDLINAKGFHEVYYCKEKTWKRMIIDNEISAFSDHDFLPLTNSEIVCMNVDLAKEAKIMTVLGDNNQKKVSFMKLMPTSNTTFSWYGDQSPVYTSSLSDWMFDDTAKCRQRFYFIKAIASEPKYLLAMRKETCGYTSSFYKFSGLENSPVNPAMFQSEGREQEFLAFPNPTTGLTRLVMSPGKIYRVSIFNLQGELMSQLDNQPAEVLLDLGFLQPGLYLIKCENENTFSAKKIIKW